MASCLYASYRHLCPNHNQTVGNQLLQLNEVAQRLGWTIVQVYTDEGISAQGEAIRTMLAAGTGIRETARRTSAGTASVMRIKQTLEAHAA